SIIMRPPVKNPIPCCPLTSKPTNIIVIFVAGIGFFSLCFLMTSLGGQFSAKRLGDSPFSIRTEGTLITGSSVRLPVLTVCMSNSSGGI
uniref:Uncharacterized protein n=1 Tax=Sinocyclocheilus anshuiensis TaxID=1608454 RepID=A0A671K4Z7_9TELE